MKKYIYAAIALAMTATACQRSNGIEENFADMRENTLTASLNTETRTMLGGLDADGYDNLWAENDAISVFIDGIDRKILYTLSEGAGTSKASFSGYGRGMTYTAVYPADAAAGIEGNNLSIELPAEQSYAKSSFGSGSFPMVAVSNSTDLQFRNLCSVLKVSMTGSQPIQAIEFKANDESISVAGKASVDISNPSAPVLTMNDGGENSVTLLCPAVSLDKTEVTDFYIVVPAQTYKGGFTLTVYSASGSMEKKTTQDITMNRSQMLSVKTFAFKVENGLAPSETLSGEGTAQSPFLIACLEDLLLFQSAVNSIGGTITSTESGADVSAQSAHYRMTENIDIAKYNEFSASWTPIGDYSTNEEFVFSGTFDGDGHSITNLRINSVESYQGFFGRISGASAHVKNLTVDGEVSGHQYVGIIAGWAYKNLSNCKAYGSVTGTNYYVGGVVGVIPSGSLIIDCSNYAEVKGYASAGGVAGCVNYATMYNCANYGNVSNISVGGYVSYYIGGVIGLAWYSSVYNCSNCGKVNGYDTVGGIVGSSQSSASYMIVNCYNTGEVYASNGYIGGIAGEIITTPTANCVNAGKLSVSRANNTFGGIAGSSSAAISNCYWLSTSGPSTAIGEDEGTSTSIHSLSASQMDNSSSAGVALYTDKDGAYYTYIVDALNAWAADNRIPTNYPYYGWLVNNGDICPTFTFEAAVHPGSGSDENLTHCFVVHHTNTTFTVPMITGDYYNATVDWGDSVTESYAETLTHTYASGGEHTVTVTADSATSFKINSIKGVSKLDLK